MLKIPIIIGPTAVGKTNYALELASKKSLEIVSADSMQVYKHMNIGTAKPTKEEMAGIPHHLIDIINPDEDWNVFSFLKEARHLLFETARRAVVVGGTGLYIRSLIYNFKTPQLEPNKEIRDKYKDIALEKGVDELHKMLFLVDPDSALKIKKADEFRIIRALEVFDITGIPFSAQQSMDESFADKFQLICLNTDRSIVYDRINKRVDIMVEQGLFAEVQKLLDMGYSSDLVSMQALGYKEVVSVLMKNLQR